ncbi:hypothetical protein F2Q70_00016394 [Brassica cretica]|uniref:Uncharacterized protein n=1 Tax=Brassica cretica TaxID=69181 RepID=A0A8S9HTL9_BRACR|nr:hypothetical protein F2Q70_00016394 [Brassica cretica]KAF2596954.1 hypothetical protein F2Q68_00009360 [Brassica cretica]
MSDLEVREAYLQSLYPLQFRCKAWPSMKLLNHGDQLLTIRPKALACRMLKHILHLPSQCFYF